MKINKLFLSILLLVTSNIFAVPYVSIRMPNYENETFFSCSFKSLLPVAIPPRTKEKLIKLPNLSKEISSPGYYQCLYYDRKADVEYVALEVRVNDEGEPTQIVPLDIGNKAVKVKITSPTSATLFSDIRYPQYHY